MQIQYKVTFTDYLAAQALHAKRNGRALFLYILSRYIYPVLGGCFLIFLLLANRPAYKLLTSPGNYLGLFACVVLLACPLLMRWSLKRIYTRTRSGPGDCTIEFAQDVIQTRMEHAKSELEWPAIRRFAEDEKAFLLYLAQAKFIVIPKRVCTAEQIHELRALFTSRIQPAS